MRLSEIESLCSGTTKRRIETLGECRDALIEQGFVVARLDQNDIECDALRVLGTKSVFRVPAEAVHTDMFIDMLKRRMATTGEDGG